MAISGLTLFRDLSSVSSENSVVLVVLASLGSDPTVSKSYTNTFFSAKPSYRQNNGPNKYMRIALRRHDKLTAKQNLKGVMIET